MAHWQTTYHSFEILRFQLQFHTLLREMALLEADVSFKVVKQFIKAVEARAVGTDVMESLTPGQMVIKIVKVNLMGSETTGDQTSYFNEITVIMMTGLPGSW